MGEGVLGVHKRQMSFQKAIYKENKNEKALERVFIENEVPNKYKPLRGFLRIKALDVLLEETVSQKRSPQEDLTKKVSTFDFCKALQKKRAPGPSMNKSDFWTFAMSSEI